jgi:hypothetical protein
MSESHVSDPSPNDTCSGRGMIPEPKVSACVFVLVLSAVVRHTIEVNTQTVGLVPAVSCPRRIILLAIRIIK